ncbi:MAG: DUF4292 domain-containing protein [Deltaproteobacteria bacterium]|nr:DUF4292 domain-containing protein [Deltaproteobacteria bacterium]
MFRYPLWWIFPLLAGLAGGCASTRPEPHAPAPYQDFLIESPLVPFQASGSILVQLMGKRETANVDIRNDGNDGWMIRIIMPVTGTSAAEVYLSGQNLTVADYTRKLYFQGENTLEARLQLLAADITPNDLKMAMTGRVEKRDFQAGGGKTSSGQVVFTQKDNRYVFAMGANGFPTNWRREQPGHPILSVVYKGWTRVPYQHQTLEIPQKIRIQADGNRSALVLGIRNFTMGAAANPAPKFSPGDGWRGVSLQTMMKQ